MNFSEVALYSQLIEMRPGWNIHNGPSNLGAEGQNFFRQARRCPVVHLFAILVLLANLMLLTFWVIYIDDSKINMD